MKGILTILSFVLIVISTNAQDRPKDGAILKISEPSITIVPGATYESEVQLIRSKKYAKAKFGGLKARTPEGLTITFTEDSDTKDTYKMLIAVADNADQKPYTIIVRGDGNNGHKIKGVAISINVQSETIVNQAN